MSRFPSAWQSGLDASREARKAAKDYAVISLHEKGFWQIDVYWKMERPPEEGDVPDHFKTCTTGDPMETALQWCRDWYMHAEVLFADEEEDEDDTDDIVGTAVCAKCGCETKGEVAWVHGADWCHPCADMLAVVGSLPK